MGRMYHEELIRYREAKRSLAPDKEKTHHRKLKKKTYVIILIPKNQKRRWYWFDRKPWVWGRYVTEQDMLKAVSTLEKKEHIRENYTIRME